MSRTREIPTQEWGRFLSSVAEGHPDVKVRLEGDDIGDQRMVNSLPLRRFEVDAKGSAHGAIEIEVGGPGGLFSHRIEKPEHVWVEESDDGRPEVIDIEDRDRHKTLVRVESQASAF